MNILLTGGAGFIGSHLTANLIRRGHQVRVLDNLRRGSFEREHLRGAELIEGDIRSLDVCLAAASGCEAIIHLAAQSNVIGSQADPEYTMHTNVTGTWNIGRAAAEAGVKHLIFASSREVYGEPAALPVPETAPIAPRNLYGASKAAGELLLETIPGGRFHLSVLRLANVIGPGDSNRVIPLFLRAATTGEPLVLFGGNQQIDFVPVEFVVEMFTRVVEGERVDGPVNIGSGTTTLLPDLARHIVQLANSSSEVAICPPRGPEVGRFRADTSKMTSVFGVSAPANPLGAIRVDW